MANENENTTGTLEKVTPEDMVSPMAENMPIPTGDPLELGLETDASGATQTEMSPPEIKPALVITDKSGRVFDNLIHKTLENGQPKFDKAGYFISVNKGRNGGRTSSDASSVKTGQATTSTETTQTQNQTEKASSNVPDAFDNAAALYFDVGTGVLSGAISDEWLPENKAEREGMIVALAAYLRAKGTVEITPGQALLFAAIAYSGKRFSKPKTKERLTIWFLKLKEFFGKPKL